ncbi:arylamine N-acetyltransferase [Saccharothrix violaceirubra]|uniref:N-hydroxyarylamine O-acetyltransferase n=1 Tax=Saccharothrix violaceirubra TaxID=413306 RepID=A0A7W7T6T7_9PSEU|nr:arylamine N-acetyltransferase [Saccharothrix violaceirubra]MBB4967641.1 N-hydroxyarylamine O-acetyltransferase [Saccharothrix violaceirubra]
MWNGDQLDLDAYLDRVDYRPERDRTVTLRGLHRAHLRAIPFENGDIVAGVPIALDLPSIQDKLVGKRRGGYCYEHNLLFAAVLDRLGYQVTGLAARVVLGRPGDVPATHALLHVDRTWLVDVGFGGGGLLEPLPLVEDAFQAQGGWSFRLDLDEPTGVFTLQTYRENAWTDLYRFTKDPRTPADYTVLSHYLSTHPNSPFTARLLVQRTEDHALRRITGSEYSVTSPDDATTTRTLTPDELTAVLRTDFAGLELPTGVTRPVD